MYCIVQIGKVVTQSAPSTRPSAGGDEDESLRAVAGYLMVLILVMIMVRVMMIMIKVRLMIMRMVVMIQNRNDNEAVFSPSLGVGASQRN